MIDHIILPANALTVFYIKFYWLKNSTKSPKVLKVKVKVVKIDRAENESVPASERRCRCVLQQTHLYPTQLDSTLFQTNKEQQRKS